MNLPGVLGCVVKLVLMYAALSLFSYMVKSCISYLMEQEKDVNYSLIFTEIDKYLAHSIIFLLQSP